MKQILLTLSSALCFISSMYGQVITEVDKHPGYGEIYIGNYYEDISKFLLKDSINAKQVWDTTDAALEGIERIYLVDLSQPELDSFRGRKVERVEVYTSQRHNNSIENPDDHRQVVDCIRIYLKKETYDEGAFQDLVGYFYVDYGAYYEEYDYPQKGDMRYTWTGSYFAFRLSNYVGENAVNRKYDLAVYYRK